MIKLFLILIEGTRFLWAIRNRRRRFPMPTEQYLWWRLGTVYGLHPAGHDGYPDGDRPAKTFKDLLLEAWRDRERVAAHLLWRRQMRKQRRRPTAVPRWLN